MSSFGVLSTGFAKKLESDIEGEIKDDQLAEIQGNLNQLPSSVVGQLNGIFSDKLREIWDLLEAVYRSQYPDSASGEALDQIGAITGAFRLAAVASSVTLTVNIDAGVTLTIGRLVSDPVSGVQFQTTAAVTNGGGSPADFPVAAEAVVTGPVQALSGVLTQIDTPVAGWNTVTNALDADLGRDRETDDAFRIRREELLRISGSSTRDGIRAAVVNTSGVTQVSVFENDTDVTDAFGLPPHSFEVVVLGGDDETVAQVIFDAKACGIQTYGSSSDVATDSQGISQDVYFSRPTTVEIYVDVTVQVNTGTFPADGEDQIKQAIVDFGDALLVGDDVIYNQVLCIPLSISGVEDVTALIVDVTAIPPGTNTDNIVIDPREFARFDTSRIDVVVT